MPSALAGCGGKHDGARVVATAARVLVLPGAARCGFAAAKIAPEPASLAECCAEKSIGNSAIRWRTLLQLRHLNHAHDPLGQHGELGLFDARSRVPHIRSTGCVDRRRSDDVAAVCFNVDSAPDRHALQMLRCLGPRELVLLSATARERRRSMPSLALLTLELAE